jgi:peptidylamidoglycolate lyase
MPTEKIKEKTILILDNKTGKIKNAWGSDLFIMPHGLEVDNEDNIWVTDVALHQVFKFNYTGELLMVLGVPNQPGVDSFHFNLPTDVAVSSNGSFYVSDGYGNSRVVKFSRQGEYLFEWGKFGTDKGAFNIPHGLDLDKLGNVYVADRENNRIQKFDSLGRFISLWQNKSIGQLYSVNIDNSENYLLGIDYVIDENFIPVGSDIFRFDLNLNLKTRFGRSGFYNGKRKRYHDIQVDNNGNIYTADILDNSLQKFRPIIN